MAGAGLFTRERSRGLGAEIRQSLSYVHVLDLGEDKVTVEDGDVLLGEEHPDGSGWLAGLAHCCHDDTRTQPLQHLSFPPACSRFFV